MDLAIYSAMFYLDATMEPTHHEIEPTAPYARGKELRNALYGPIIPACLDEHLKRYTRASGEFELAFGREPNASDVLCHDHVVMMHSSQNYSTQVGRIVEAWQRQLPQLTCPVKFEDGRLFRRLAPERRGEEPRWEEDVRIQPDVRWLQIPEVLENTDLDSMLTISAVVFLGVGGVKHSAGRRPMRSCNVKKQNRSSKNRLDSCLEGNDLARCWWKRWERETLFRR